MRAPRYISHARFSRPAPWMARGGGAPNPCRITGTPSLGEVPSVGARAFWLLWGFSKVTRCKSGTHSSRNLNNGYVPGLIQHPRRLSGRLRGQARSHIWIVALPVDCGRLSGRLRGQARSHIWIVALPVDCGRLSGRLRGQARSHSWIVALPVDCGRLSGPLRGRASSHSCIGG